MLTPLRAAESRFEAAFRHAPSAIVILDRQGVVVAANPTLRRIVGSWADQLAGRPFPDLAEAADRPAVHAALGALIGGTLTGLGGDFRFRTADGSVGWFHGRAARLPGEPTFIVHLVDVTARRQERADLADRVLRDPLTGLVNRTGVLDALAAALRGPDPEVAVLFADLDGFKAINDQYGHPIGDQVLVAVARRMRAGVPSSDPVGRIGGDEFAIVLRGAQAAGRARQVAERLRRAVHRPISVTSRLLRVGVSIGIASAHVGDQVTADSLLADADTAMYQAKSRGRREAGPAGVEDRASADARPVPTARARF